MLRLGIDIGGTNIIAGLVDENANIVKKLKTETKNMHDGSAFVGYLMNFVNELLSLSGHSIKDVAFCGVGIPGTVSPDGKTAVKVPNLGWSDFSLAQMLEEELDVNTVLIQDSHAAAYGEYTAGGGMGKEALVCITLGTGIGTGIVMDGEVYHGKLGYAGELGHVPVVKDGILCGCGKRGCLENYSAGKGLNIKAKSIYGESGSSEELFRKAGEGDERAISAIADSVEKLGNVIVGMINLLSPDCLLFSGGLSAQRELFVEPLIDYIQTKRYSLDGKDDFKIGLAKLGEDAPMIGAAMIGKTSKKRSPKVSASIMCANWLDMGNELIKIEKAGVEYLHCDIMDNHFVPNMMLPPELLSKIRHGSSLPYDIHIMAENPEKVISQLSVKKGDIVAVHYESTVHVQRALALIAETGAMPAIAINPATPIESIYEILPDVGMVLIMTVNPGYAGQKLVPQTLDKIKRARAMLDEAGYEDVMIEVDGNCSFENIPKMYEAGAEIFVAGTSSLFSKETDIQEAMKKIKNSLI